MSKTVFKANVQYDDMKGTVAADNQDTEDVWKYLKTRNLITETEFIAGITFSVGEIHPPLSKDVLIHVSAYIHNSSSYDNFKAVLDSRKPVEVREVSLEILPNEFLSLFKRLNLTLSQYGSLEGKKIIIREE